MCASARKLVQLLGDSNESSVGGGDSGLRVEETEESNETLEAPQQHAWMSHEIRVVFTTKDLSDPACLGFPWALLILRSHCSRYSSIKILIQSRVAVC